jgi:caa(3)-type oxidase subunit IV
VKTLLTLTALMLLTIFASYWNLPGGVLSNNLLALAIAFTKSFLVIWVFMGIRWSAPLPRLWAVAGFIVLPLMFIMFQDFFMRGNEVIAPWDGKPESALPKVLNPEASSQQVPGPEAGLRPHG